MVQEAATAKAAAGECERNFMLLKGRGLVSAGSRSANTRGIGALLLCA